MAMLKVHHLTGHDPELERLEISVPRALGQNPLYDTAQQETAQRLGYWWGKLRKFEGTA